MTARQDIRSGRFVRTRQPWSPERWDDGFFDNRGRFRVFRPDCPRAYEGGYALRTHVVWWLAYGEPHPEGTNLHHINEDRADDRLENLRVMSHGEHTRFHKGGRTMKWCVGCGAEFYDPKKPKRKYCTLACYHAKTHCPSGHLYSEANTYVTSTGQRMCRTCNRDRQRLRRQEARL